MKHMQWKRTASILALGCSLALAAAGAARAETYHWLTARTASSAAMLAMQATIDRYKETHPDFDIEIEYIPNRPAFLQKVKILATSNELPELFDADAEPYFYDIVAAGLVADIGAIFDELDITDNFVPFALDYERLDDGGLYLIPFQSNTEYFYYNKTLFAKAGIEPPTTLDGLLQACDALRAAGVTPVSVDGLDGWPMYRYLSLPAWRMTGNEFLKELKVGEASMSDPAGLASAQYLRDVGTRCFQEGFTATDYTAALDLFTSGQAAIYYVGTWELASFLDEDGELKEDIGYFKVPVIEGQTATKPSDFYAHSGIGTAIRVDAVTDELKDFLRYFAETYGATSLYEFNAISSIKTELRDDLPKVYRDILADMDAVGEYTQVWDVKLDAGTVDVLFRQSQLLALGQITPEQFGEEVDRSIQQYLAGQ